MHSEGLAAVPDTGTEMVELNLEKPTVLFREGDHAVYWLGITNETVFRCNTYLIVDGDEAFLVDPGSRAFFSQVRGRVAQIMDPEKVTHMILCHQDPDVAASMVDWLDMKEDIKVVASERTHVLLPHFGNEGYGKVVTEEIDRYEFAGGKGLVFCRAPFLHFSGAFATYDEVSGLLFSGDIWAALDMDWTLQVTDMDEHLMKMDFFHANYMASNKACRGFLKGIDDLEIKGILPQHGSIIPKQFVGRAKEYLRNLKCGLDLLYP